jgi:hypothetical protein
MLVSPVICGMPPVLAAEELELALEPEPGEEVEDLEVSVAPPVALLPDSAVVVGVVVADTLLIEPPVIVTGAKLISLC